ncbi:unnamed protein product [Rotaria magnacalcarata]
MGCVCVRRISTSTIVHGFCLFLFCRIRALRETHIPTNSHQYAMNLFYFRQRSVLYRQCTTKTDNKRNDDCNSMLMLLGLIASIHFFYENFVKLISLLISNAALLACQ